MVVDMTPSGHLSRQERKNLLRNNREIARMIADDDRREQRQAQAEAEAFEADADAVEEARLNGTESVQQLRRERLQRTPETDAQSSDSLLSGLRAAGGHVTEDDFRNPSTGDLYPDE